MSQDMEIGNAIPDTDHVFGEEGAQIRVPEEVYQEAKASVSAQHSVSNRWLKAEPAISATFGATKNDDGVITNANCYTDGTSEHRALVDMLTEVHPLTSKIEAKILTIKNMRVGGADSDKIGQAELERDTLRQRRKVDLANAMRALKTYFLKDQGGERSKPARKVPMDILVACAERLAKFNADNSTPADLTIAERALIVVKAMLQDVDAVYLNLPLATPKASPIDKSFTKSGPVVDITEQYKAQQVEVV